MVVIVGLGNPGKEYERTKHNIGFDILDLFAEKHTISFNKTKHRAFLGEGFVSGKKVLLVKPQTYMNLSGESVREILEYYKLDAETLVVIYDDISLPVGKIRIRQKGSAGGHNGIKNIIYQLHTDVFPRIKVGVGGPKSGQDLAHFVLSRFSKEDEEVLSQGIKNSLEALEVMIAGDIQKAMNQYNS